MLIASINKLVSAISGAGCFASLAWAAKHYLWTYGTMAPSEENMVSMISIGVSQTMDLVAISVVICGINAVIGIALSLKWRESQPAL